MNIQSTANIETQYIKAVVYGLSGSGKTTLSKTLKNYKPLVISAEGGLMSISGSEIDFVDITKDDEGKLIPKEKRADRLKEVYAYVQSETKYDTLILDSLTEMGQCVFDSVKLLYPDPKQALPMWGEYGIRMRDMVKAFRDLPKYHVVFNTLSKIDKDENGQRFTTFDLSGSIGDKLPGFLDLVLYLRANADGIRELVCQPTSQIIAKDRSGKLEKVEPANLGLVFDKILKGK